jgi:hypothetical protein
MAGVSCDDFQLDSFALKKQNLITHQPTGILRGRQGRRFAPISGQTMRQLAAQNLMNL